MPLCRSIAALLACLTLAVVTGCTSRDPTITALEKLERCRLPGLDREARCGSIEVAENPDAPHGRTIRVAYAVVAATATHRAPDAIFVLAGGPGQSALSIAGQVWPLFDALNARRDIVLIDQRGTGRSHPLACAASGQRVALGDAIDPSKQIARLRACRDTLAKTSDLAQYATWIAVRDFDRVREALGYTTIDLWGGSYGTRAALEYARQFPNRVRAMVLDGVAPADLALPASFAFDADAALDALDRACRADARCHATHPDSASDTKTVLAASAAGFAAQVPDPYFGTPTALAVDHRVAASLIRAPLYTPTLSAVLPYALARATHGDLTPLVGLSSVLDEAIEGEAFAEGMHYAVICSEDETRAAAHDRAAVAHTRMGDLYIDQYEKGCDGWPTRPVPAAFFAMPTIDVPVLMLSGGLDPATPPMHAEAIAKSLPHATHVVAPNLGHLVSPHACAPTLVRNFLRQGNADGLDGTCLQRIPPPWFFEPPAPATRTTEAAR